MSHTPLDNDFSSNYQLIFDSALNAYKKKTGKDLQSDPLFRTLENCNSPSAIIDVLRQQIPAIDQSGSSNGRLTNWLNPTVNVLCALSTTISHVVSPAYPPARIIFTGIGSLLSAAQAVCANQGVLVDLFERIENFLRRLEAYIKLPPTGGMTDIIVKVMVEVLLILALATREIKQGKLKKFLKKLEGKSDIKDALQRLDKLTQEENRMAAAQDLRATCDVAEGVKNVENDVHNIHYQVKGVDDKMDIVVDGGEKMNGKLQQLANDMGDQKRNQLRQDLAKWLSPPDPSVNYNTACDARHEGTAVWFIESSTFENWKDSSGLLWIYGKPGSGKSVLTSAIIQGIRAISSAGSGHLAFFFFDFKDTGKQDARPLLSSLIVQLSNQSDSFYDILRGFHSAHQGGTQQPSVGALTECLEEMLTVPGEVPIYLIVDALDECPNTTGMPSLRKQVLTLVDRLVKLGIPSLRLCITSRPEIDIRTSLEALTSTLNRLSLHDEIGQRNDINEFIKAVVHSDDNMRRWRDKDKQLVIETLSNRADGMFRWVFCQLQILCHCLPQSVRSILAELPETLDETYERILHQIPKSNRVYAHRLLQCLTVAVRPLRAKELAEVLAMKFTETGVVPILDEDLRWEDQEQAVLSACSSLITIVDDWDSRVVQFSHFSVKEFLTSNRLATSKVDPSRHHHISLEGAHSIMAQACLCVLLRLDDQMNEVTIKTYPLAQYAADHFGDHAKSENVVSQMSDGVECLLDQHQPHFFAWLRTRRTLRWGQSLEGVPLYYVAAWGFRGLAQHLVSRRPGDVMVMGGGHGTPLHAAISYGHVEVSRLLLQHCVDVDILDFNGRTPLHLATYRGYFEITQMLIRRHANIDARDDNGQTPLHRIVDGLDDSYPDGYFNMVRLLLEHGADADAQDNDFSTALHLASFYGCSKAIRPFLEHGANTNIRNKNGQTPLHQLVGNLSDTNDDVYFDLVRALLERGADTDVQDDDLSTALHLALSNGCSTDVWLLLEHGANPNLRNNKGQTPLHQLVDDLTDTSDVIHFKLIRALLERGADTDVQDNDLSTALHLATSHRCSKAIQLLLEHGANPNVWNSHGRTPLHVALDGEMASVSLDTLFLLLKHDADVNAQSNDNSTPLHLAAYQGFSKAAQMLLDHEANVHIQNSEGQTPLHLAITYMHGSRLDEFRKVARLLLDHNAIVDAQDSGKSSPLQLASRHGNYEGAKLLLERGANVHVTNKGKTPLHEALEGGFQFWGNYLDLARILLDHGADVNAQDDDQSTPLHLASCKGLVEAAGLLLERGANIHLRHNDGRTPLHCASQDDHFDIVQLLLKYHADVGARDHTDSTPLHLASSRGALGPAWLLLGHGADVQARDMKGGTPLHDATWGGYLEVMELLVEHGADLDALSNNGWLPLHLAAYKEDLDAVEFLLKHGAHVRLGEDTGENIFEVGSVRIEEISGSLSGHRPDDI